MYENSICTFAYIRLFLAQCGQTCVCQGTLVSPSPTCMRPGWPGTDLGSHSMTEYGAGFPFSKVFYLIPNLNTFLSSNLRLKQKNHRQLPHQSGIKLPEIPRCCPDTYSHPLPGSPRHKSRSPSPWTPPQTCQSPSELPVRQPARSRNLDWQPELTSPLRTPLLWWYSWPGDWRGLDRGPLCNRSWGWLERRTWPLSPGMILSLLRPQWRTRSWVRIRGLGRRAECQAERGRSPRMRSPYICLRGWAFPRREGLPGCQTADFQRCPEIARI